MPLVSGLERDRHDEAGRGSGAGRGSATVVVCACCGDSGPAARREEFSRAGRGGSGRDSAEPAVLGQGLASILTQGAREAHVGVDRAGARSVGRTKGRRCPADGEAPRAARSVAVAAVRTRPTTTRKMNRFVVLARSRRLVTGVRMCRRCGDTTSKAGRSWSRCRRTESIHSTWSALRLPPSRILQPLIRDAE